MPFPLLIYLFLFEIQTQIDLAQNSSKMSEVTEQTGENKIASERSLILAQRGKDLQRNKKKILCVGDQLSIWFIDSTLVLFHFILFYFFLPMSAESLFFSHSLFAILTRHHLHFCWKVLVWCLKRLIKEVEEEGINLHTFLHNFQLLSVQKFKSFSENHTNATNKRTYE